MLQKEAPMLQLTFTLNPADKTPLYEQLYAAIAQQIRSGSIAPNTRLPGKRSLASELSVSVSTVDTAYQILTAEGYLESRERSGFFVQEYHEMLPFGAAMHHGMGHRAPSITTQTDAMQTPPKFDLSGTGIDPALFPFRTWGRIQKELLYTSPELLLRGDAQGDESLRIALAEYLAAFRGVHCHAAQIVVGAGMEYLLSLLAPLLPKQGGVEHPGYPRATAVLENSDITCVHLPVDDKGLCVTALRENGANFCYVTPSHQYPTGVTMPVGRRAALLHWAREGNADKTKRADNAEKASHTRYIIEDDYDSEFRFDIRPLPSLQGMAGADETVIYLTTFSKSLAPSIRIAAMVLPEHLLCAWQARYGSYASTVSRFEQQTLCRFLREGYFARHLARTRGIYKARRNALVRELERAFGKENIRLQGLHTGLHLLLQVNADAVENATSLAYARNPSNTAKSITDTTLAAACAAAGVACTPLSKYYTSDTPPCPANTLLLGYGALQETDAPEAAARLAKAILG